MMAYLRSLLQPAKTKTDQDSITNDIAPKGRDAEKERQILEARSRFVGEVMSVERKVNEIRHELAGSALRIVAGER